LLITGQSYEESTFAQCETRHRLRLEANLRRHARELGFELVATSA
jgi:hypothetical protein